MSKYTTKLGPNRFFIKDHMEGFDREFNNYELDQISGPAEVTTEYHLDQTIKQKYADLDFKFSADAKSKVIHNFAQYNEHPPVRYKNFICSFNGAAHVGRKLLVSILQKFGYFNTDYCSKNFSYTVDTLDGHLADYVDDRINYYRKFFIADDSQDFFQSVYSLNYTRYEHDKNIYNLENYLTESFLHLVSETLATSYYPFVTEKFLYSVVTRGLFLSYAQPGWHQHVEKYYGFRRYTKLFDYRFDAIQNPIERLVELITMVSKFSILTPHEWHDLYLIEQDTIEYNYDHYHSGDFLKMIEVVR